MNQLSAQADAVVLSRRTFFERAALTGAGIALLTRESYAQTRQEQQKDRQDGSSSDPVPRTSHFSQRTLTPINPLLRIMEIQVPYGFPSTWHRNVYRPEDGPTRSRNANCPLRRTLPE